MGKGANFAGSKKVDICREVHLPEFFRNLTLISLFCKRSLSLEKTKKRKKSYNSRYSLVVTHPTTNLPI
jgi:hypothetical protein